MKENRGGTRGEWHETKHLATNCADHDEGSERANEGARGAGREGGEVGRDGGTTKHFTPLHTARCPPREGPSLRLVRLTYSCEGEAASHISCEGEAASLSSRARADEGDHPITFVCW